MRALCILLVACGRLHFDPAASCAQTGELVIDATSTTATVPLAVPLERSILFVSMREAEPSPSYGNTQCQLAEDGITCVRLKAGTDSPASAGTITVRWTVATIPTGVSVQRGTTKLSVGTAAVAAADPDASFLVMTGSYGNPGASWGTDEYIRGRMVDAQTLGFDALGAAAVVAWQVVTIDGAHVQRGDLAFATADTVLDATIAPVDPDRAFALATWTYDSSVGLGAARSMLAATLPSTSTLEIARTQPGAPANVAWQVIELPFPVARGVVTLAPGESTATVPATGAVALATGMSILGTSGGETDLPTSIAQPDVVGEAAATFELAQGRLVVTRATAASTATLPFAAIDLCE